MVLAQFRHDDFDQAFAFFFIGLVVGVEPKLGRMDHRLSHQMDELNWGEYLEFIAYLRRNMNLSAKLLKGSNFSTLPSALFEEPETFRNPF